MIKLIFQKGKYHKKDTCLFRNYAIIRNFFILRVHKFFKKISTQLLTVLIMRAIVQIEQRKRDKESKI